MINRITVPGSYSCKSIYNYWMSKCSDNVVATRAQINPNEIKHILPLIAMMDVIDDGNDFRVRLIGSEVQRYLKHNCTGERLSECGEFESKVLLPWYKLLLREKKAIMGTIDTRQEEMNISFDGEIISMPLMNAKNTEVSIILSVIVRANHWSKLTPVQKKIRQSKSRESEGVLAETANPLLL